MQWLKLPAWEVGYPGFVPRSGIKVSKKQNVSQGLETHIRRDGITWMLMMHKHQEKIYSSQNKVSPLAAGLFRDQITQTGNCQSKSQITAAYRPQ